MLRRFATSTAFKTAARQYSLRCATVFRPPITTFATKPVVFTTTIPKRWQSKSTSGENVEPLIDDLDPRQYSTIADEYLEDLCDQLEAISEEFPQIDAELNHGVMTLTTAPGKNYVINKQPPNKQIWLSSPISGPKRYDLINGKWTTLRDGSRLSDLLSKEISDELGVEFSLDLLN